MLEEKNKIRKLIKEIKKTITDDYKQNASDKVFSLIFKLNEWNEAEKILMYYSLPDELPTEKYLKLITDKNIYLPKVNGNDLDILLYEKDKLCIGKYGIMESFGSVPIKPNEIDLVLVPGIAFDIKKNRLGRGKGYYDKLLKTTKAVKIGIGFSFQLMECIPHNDNDIKMDIIITPDSIIR